MILTDPQRLKIETFAKEAARRQYRRNNPEASDAEAFGFALRSWRSPEFVQAGAEILAIWRVLDETAAAPFN